MRDGIGGAADAVVLVRGTGAIGQRHLRVLRDRLGVTARAWPIRQERSVELAAAGYVVQSERPQSSARFAGVIIATDTSRHLADIEELACLGPIFVEKPLAPTASGIATAYTALADAASQCWVAFPLRFEPGMAAVRRIVQEIGRIYSVRAECQSYLPDWRPGTDYRRSYAARPDEGGVLRDLCHELDYVTWLFGPAQAISAKLSNLGVLGIATEEVADLSWVSNSGVAVSIRLDYLSRVHRRRLSVVAERGTVDWDLRSGDVTVTRLEGPTLHLSLGVDRDLTFAEMDRAFLAAAGGDVPDERLVGFDEAAQLVLLTEAARQSSECGKEVQVPKWLGAGLR